MTDRRRINGPSSGTRPVSFADKVNLAGQPRRNRAPNELRRIFLKTGHIPSANGSAYLELEVSTSIRALKPSSSTLKLSCSIHGPKPIDRNASFSPNLQLNASVKFAPFVTSQRRGYIRDNIERDLGGHLENALKGAVILERWPKSALEVTVTVLEGEDDEVWAQHNSEGQGINGIGYMNVLAGSITVSSAALADAKIDCLDMISGGVAARATIEAKELLDPCPSDDGQFSSACVVGYLPNRDEITEIWTRSSAENGNLATLDKLTDAAVKAARGSHKILGEVLLEYHQNHAAQAAVTSKKNAGDVEMAT